MECFYTYIVRCANGAYYTGHTDNLENRIAEHNTGTYKGYTSRYLPVELVYVEFFATRDEAFVAEHKIKGWTRGKKEALMASQWEELVNLAKKKFDR